MNNTTIAANLYPVANGTTSSGTFVDIFQTRDPTGNDLNYSTQKKWLNTSTGAYWILEAFTSTGGFVQAVWVKIGSTLSTETLTGNDHIVVPSSGFNINVVGDGTYITTVGNAATSTLTIEPAGGLTTLYTANVGTATPSAGNLNVLGTAGITVTGSGSTLTIKGEGISTWNVISASQNLAVNNGYFLVAPGGAISLALPATSVLGDTIRIALNGATSFTITQGASQQIRVSGSQSTLGATGTVSSTGTGDTIEIVCQVANTIWVALFYNGNLTVT